MVLRTASASAAVTQATQPAAYRPAANTVRTRRAPARADRAGAVSRSIEAAPEAPTPARSPIGFDRRGPNAERSQLAADQVSADADLLRDIRKRAALLAHRHNRCDLVLEQRHPPYLLGRRQLAAVFQPARVAGNVGALCDRQFRALLRAHRLARASLGLHLDVGHHGLSRCPSRSPAPCRLFPRVRSPEGGLGGSGEP